MKIRPNNSDHARTGRHFHGVGCNQSCMTVRSGRFARAGIPADLAVEFVRSASFGSVRARVWVRFADFFLLLYCTPRPEWLGSSRPERRCPQVRCEGPSEGSPTTRPASSTATRRRERRESSPRPHRDEAATGDERSPRPAGPWVRFADSGDRSPRTWVRFPHSRDRPTGSLDTGCVHSADSGDRRSRASLRFRSLSRRFRQPARPDRRLPFLPLLSRFPPPRSRRGISGYRSRSPRIDLRGQFPRPPHPVLRSPRKRTVGA